MLGDIVGVVRYKVIDLAQYTSFGVRVYSGRDRGRAIREGCGVKPGDRVSLLIPPDTISMNAGFLDDLLRDTVIVHVEPEKMAAYVFETLYRRRVAFAVDRPQITFGHPTIHEP